MFYILFVVVVNLALGFALAVYLGGHYAMVRKFGMKIPLPMKTPSAATLGRSDPPNASH